MIDFNFAVPAVLAIYALGSCFIAQSNRMISVVYWRLRYRLFRLNKLIETYPWVSYCGELSPSPSLDCEYAIFTAGGRQGEYDYTRKRQFKLFGYQVSIVRMTREYDITCWWNQDGERKYTFIFDHQKLRTQDLARADDVIVWLDRELTKHRQKVANTLAYRRECTQQGFRQPSKFKYNQ